MTLESQSPLVPVTTEYVTALEHRVAQLEGQLQQVQRAQILQQSQPAALPNTQLLSPNFLTRAFAVWGHYFVAQFMIGLVFLCLYFGFIALMGILLGGSSLFGN